MKKSIAGIISTFRRIIVETTKLLSVFFPTSLLSGSELLVGRTVGAFGPRLATAGRKLDLKPL